MHTIDEWLASLGLSEYSDKFHAHGIDVSVLPDLTESDLVSIGVLLGHRRKILKAVTNLRTGTPIAPTADTPGDHVTSSERRQLTVMFCDMVGSTALSAQLDPEDMRQIILDYQSTILDTVTQFHGVVARQMGDGVLVYFGYPHAEEDYAEQSIHAGLALINAFKNSSELSPAIRIRIGIATGTVVVGAISIGEHNTEQAVVGDTPNLAARLQSIAEPGSMLVCENTYRLAKGHFHFTKITPAFLRGWDNPVPAWRAVEPKRIESRFEASHETKLPPLVGREEEVELLSKRWKQTMGASGRVVTLLGEPGIGKSHVVLSFADRIQSDHHHALRYFCSPHHTNSALFPVISQIERAATFEPTDPPDVKLSKLINWLGTDIEPSDIALVAYLLHLETDDTYQVLDILPQQRKARLLELLFQRIKRLSLFHPLLIVFEDVHWIDPSSLQLLTSLVERAADLPIFLIVTARPEFTPPWPSYSHTTLLPLTRLGRREGAELIRRVAGRKSLPEDVENEILSRTDGVPLFVEELTKAVIESGALRELHDRYVIDEPLPSLAIPSTLQASLVARLDRLAPVREIAQIGAVIGRDFTYELLSVVAGLSSDRLNDSLAQLVRAELLFARGEPPQSTYTFKHSLVRDTAYTSLLKSRRIQIHGKIAKTLESQFPDFAQSQPELLAHHLTEGGLYRESLSYWLRAGRNAAQRSAHIEASAHLYKGLDVAYRLPEDTERTAVELNFHFELGPCLIATKGPASSEAMATFTKARRLCEQLGDPPEYLQILFWQTTASVIRGELVRANESIDALLSLAKVRRDVPALLNATRGQAMILLFMGRFTEAREALNQAVDIFHSSDESDQLAARAAGQDALVADLALLSWTLWIMGHIDQAVESIDAAIGRAETLDHPHTKAYAYYYSSVLHALRDENDIALDYAERCLNLSERHAFRQWHGLSTAVKGICIARIDNSMAALVPVTTALDDYHRSGYQLGITALLVLMCRALLVNEQPERAIEVAERGLIIVDQNSERVFQAELLRLKALALWMKRGFNAGTEADQCNVTTLLERALVIAEHGQARTQALDCAIDLFSTTQAGARRDLSYQKLISIYRSFTDGFNTHLLRRARSVLGNMP